MSNYIEFMKIYPITIKSILDVVKRNNYFSAQDMRQLAKRGCPITKLLIKSCKKASNIDELYTLIRDKKITFDDVKNAINQWRKET